MDAIGTVRDQLVPLVDRLVEQLEAEADSGSALWFRQVRDSLVGARSEEDLIMIFIEQLGPTGPMANAADFTILARYHLDALLAKAQEVAFTFSAGGDAH
jgi:hypothetical protein